MYDMSRLGFEALLVPSDENMELIEVARAELDNATAATGGAYVGVHLRRGDRLPWRLFHRSQESFIPMSDFISEIDEHWDIARITNSWLPTSPITYVATASPSLAAQLSSTSPPSSTILSLSSSTSPTLSPITSLAEYTQLSFALLPPARKVTLTRGAVVDFDLLVGGWQKHPAEVAARRKPVATVCTLSSNVCRMAAVALGWEGRLRLRVRGRGGGGLMWMGGRTLIGHRRRFLEGDCCL